MVSQLRRRGRNPRGTSAQPQEPPGTTTSPGLAAPREGHRLETPGGREWGGMGGREAPTRVRTAPASGSRRAPSRASERASEPSPTRWSPGQPSSSSALGPAPRPLQPRRPAPTVGAPSLLELLDLLQAQPRALVDAEVAQHLLHRLCVSVLHGCGGPGRPRLASPRPPPRLRLALGPRARATAGARARTAVSPPLSPPPPPLLLLGRRRRRRRGCGRFRLTGR